LNIKHQTNTGTKEWAPHSRNIFTGCAHDCKYCYAREMALRYGKCEYREFWSTMVLNEKALNEKPSKLKGRIMFPTTHDIFPDDIEGTIAYLRGWLNTGNEILIVTKPHIGVIEELCDAFTDYRDAIIFRFTIGSTDNNALSFWEPGAPDFQERLFCLKYAYMTKYKTSVSIEPYLDGTVLAVVRHVYPYVTDTIWIGLMNQINRRVDTKGWSEKDINMLDYTINCQKPKWVRYFYNALKDVPKIRWKDSIRKLLNLPEEPDVS
jgi:DNA repair photolyase